MVREAAGAILAVLATICGAQRVGPSAGPVSVGLQSPNVTLSLDKPRCAAGDTIRATLVVTNRSEAAVLLPFATTQRYDFALTDASGREVWRWAADRMFGQEIGEEHLEPGGRLAYTERLRAPAVPGGYRLAGTIVVTGAPLTASAAITVSPS